MEMFCKRPFHLWEKEKRVVLPAIELLNFHSSKMDAKPAFDGSLKLPLGLSPWKVINTDIKRSFCISAEAPS